ncbi:50S ribosome-binding GTPase [Candidatus Haliotispira prima]|uniref:50S ribosome-binding GTPase n=1 Tax=Candidatus Haliotispira prima TaxID=3034016 RepID=A0ABY8MI90_9SPIO|nr:50S ribosome-binding GTPase [Candidatus Haliotispira prima]
MSELKRCNILVLGKTGVGKSSLLNYILDKELEKTGVGRPQTEKGIFPHEANINGIDVKIFDTWGLEVGKDQEWKKLIQDHLKEHGIEKEIVDWIHAAIYCINVAGHRAEDIDTKMIRELVDGGFHVTVALTNADSLTESDEKKFCSVIYQKIPKGSVSIIPICSVIKKRRDGTETKRFGKNDLVDQILGSYRKLVIEKLPKRIVHLLLEEQKSLWNSLVGGSDGFPERIEDSEGKKRFTKEFQRITQKFAKETVPGIAKDESQKISDVGENLKLLLEDDPVKIKTRTIRIPPSFWEKFLNFFKKLFGIEEDETETHICINDQFDLWKSRIESFEEKIRESLQESLGTKNK